MALRSTAAPYLLTRILWMPRVVLALTLTLFVAVGLADVAHVHKRDATKTGDVVHCGLCIQLERAAMPPPSLSLPAANGLLLWVSTAPLAIPVTSRSVHSYDARGPPTIS
jgi:hypothetical protein